jgi:predicted amidohydrolase
MDLTISLIQSSIFWKSPEANRSMFEEKISPLTGQTDLIVLPEMFTTGFTMDADEIAEPPGLTTERWMKQMAARTGAVVTGSYVVADSGQYFNRLLWVTPQGDVGVYNKRHLFRMAREDQFYTPGNSKLICRLKGWNVALYICYDLRFPVWLRNQYDTNKSEFDYDLAVFVANWPGARGSAWDILLKSRAIENSCFVAGVNRTGKDGVDVDYEGGSMAVDARGKVLKRLSAEEAIITVMLNRSELASYRKKFPVHLDSDPFTVG